MALDFEQMASVIEAVAKHEQFAACCLPLGVKLVLPIDLCCSLVV